MSRFVLPVEEKHCNDVLSAYNELIIGEWTEDMFIRWCNSNTSNSIKEHALLMFSVYNSNKK